MINNLYDELDGQGNLVASKVKLIPGMTLKLGHRWVPHQPALHDEVHKKKEEIAALRDQDCYKSVLVDNHWFQADPRSQELLATTINLAVSGVAPVPPTWRSEDNEDVPADLELLKKIAAAIYAQTATSYKKSWELKEALKGADTKEKISNIRW